MSASIANIRAGIEDVIRQTGTGVIISAIDSTVAQFKQAGYTREETKETLREYYWGIEKSVDEHLLSKGF